MFTQPPNKSVYFSTLQSRAIGYGALPLLVAIVVASIFVTLAAYQILPAGANDINNLGIMGKAIAFASLVIGVIGTILSIAYLHYQRIQQPPSVVTTLHGRSPITSPPPSNTTSTPSQSPHSIAVLNASATNSTQTIDGKPNVISKTKDNDAKLPSLDSTCPKELWATALRTKKIFPAGQKLDKFKTMHEAAAHFLQNIDEIEKLLQANYQDLARDWDLIINGGEIPLELVVSFDSEGAEQRKQLPVKVAGLRKTYQGILKSPDGTYNYEQFVRPLKVAKQEIQIPVYRSIEYLGKMRRELCQESRELPNPLENVFNYEGYLYGFCRKLKEALEGTEVLEGIADNFVQCFVQFRNLVSTPSIQNKAGAKNRVLALSTHMREYLAQRENPYISGRQDGVAEDTFTLLQTKLFPTSEPSIKLKNLRFLESGECVGDYNKSTYIVISYMNVPYPNHYNNIVFNPASRRYIQLDTLPNAHKPIDSNTLLDSFRNGYCIPWEYWEKIDRTKVDHLLDVEQWVIPQNQNNNCFFVTALLQCVIYSLWDSYVKKTDEL